MVPSNPPCFLSLGRSYILWRRHPQMSGKPRSGKSCGSGPLAMAFFLIWPDRKVGCYIFLYHGQKMSKVWLFAGNGHQSIHRHSNTHSEDSCYRTTLRRFEHPTLTWPQLFNPQRWMVQQYDQSWCSPMSNQCAREKTWNNYKLRQITVFFISLYLISSWSQWCSMKLYKPAMSPEGEWVSGSFYFFTSVTNL
jgi:hypothetical protein